MRNLVLLLLAGVLVVSAALAGAPILERHRRVSEMQALWAALDQARQSADSCKITLAWEEDDFLRFDRGLDSLRRVVEAFENPELGGVLQPDYGDYLERFDRYNDLVQEWQGQADTLQAREARCRALVEAHNHLADSIQAIREERWGPEGGTP